MHISGDLRPETGGELSSGCTDRIKKGRPASVWKCWFGLADGGVRATSRARMDQGVFLAFWEVTLTLNGLLNRSLQREGNNLNVEKRI